MLSIFSLNRNNETTQESTYKNDVVSEINDIKEISQGTFPFNLKLVEKYQQTEPRLMAKYKDDLSSWH